MLADALDLRLRATPVLRGEIHHPPWPLRPVEAEIEARRQDVVFRPLRRGGAR